jgi:hypothetical protein
MANKFQNSNEMIRSGLVENPEKENIERKNRKTSKSRTWKRKIAKSRI